jgi:transcriptional regulator with XRE-family HTH domain
MPNDADWLRLADYVVARRTQLGITSRTAFASASGIAVRTVSQVETGHRVWPSTLAALEEALGWSPGSCRAVLDGGEPVMAVTAEDAEADEQLRLLTLRFGELTPSERRGLVALVEGMTGEGRRNGTR